jgi:hypothetical protein
MSYLINAIRQYGFIRYNTNGIECPCRQHTIPPGEALSQMLDTCLTEILRDMDARMASAGSAQGTPGPADARQQTSVNDGQWMQIQGELAQQKKDMQAMQASFHQENEALKRKMSEMEARYGVLEKGLNREPATPQQGGKAEKPAAAAEETHKRETSPPASPPASPFPPKAEYKADPARIAAYNAFLGGAGRLPGDFDAAAFEITGTDGYLRMRKKENAAPAYYICKTSCKDCFEAYPVEAAFKRRDLLLYIEDLFHIEKRGASKDLVILPSLLFLTSFGEYEVQDKGKIEISQR